MPLSQIVKKICPTCSKIAVESSRLNFGDSKLIWLECGHSLTEEIINSADYSSIISSDGRSLFKYQEKGIEFLEQSNARALIADEQGLGKTVQVLGALKLHPELLPAVIVCKTTLKAQWFHEIIRWTSGREEYLTQVIQTSKERPIPYAFGIYITTFDILKTEGMFDDVIIKTLIIDECQVIKNHLAERSKVVASLSKKVEHVIALSGTPIKNNAGEYFNILNILQPTRFPEYSKFIREYCDAYWTGYGTKVGGLKDSKNFKESTEDFIIRRTQKEVLPDLPEMSRCFHHVELDKKLNKAYSDGMKELEEIMYSNSDENTMTNILAIYTKLRRITGISKVAEAIDWTADFLESTDRKLTIFLHHHTVEGLLKSVLDKYLKEAGLEESISLTSTLSGDARAAIVKKFENGNCRVMIASTLAAGEGLNLQFCSDAIMLERQWNPANEEQAEKRFHRIGQSNKVTITYFIASETIDEYFTELVEQKRAIVKGTLDGEMVQWDSNSLMKDLANILVTRGKKKWSL